jgi:hypothetical protein
MTYYSICSCFLQSGAAGVSPVADVTASLTAVGPPAIPATDATDARIQGLSKSEAAEAQSEPLLILDAPRRPASWLDHDPYL